MYFNVHSSLLITKLNPEYLKLKIRTWLRFPIRLISKSFCLDSNEQYTEHFPITVTVTAFPSQQNSLVLLFFITQIYVQHLIY